MFDNIVTSVKDLVFFLWPSPKFPSLIHIIYLEFTINNLQNFTRVIFAAIFHQHPIPNWNFFPTKILIKLNITSYGLICSWKYSNNTKCFTIGNIWNIKFVCTLILMFGTGRIWCQFSVISSDFFSISSDNMKNMLIFRLRWQAISRNSLHLRVHYLHYQQNALLVLLNHQQLPFHAMLQNKSPNDICLSVLFPSV